MRIFVCFLVLWGTASAERSNNDYQKYLTILGFSLEKNTLNDVRKRLGYVNIYEEGDAAFYTATICYFLKDNSGTLYFYSGELGGEDHLINSIDITSGIEKDKNCGKLEINAGSIQVGNLRIGEKMKYIYKHMPRPIVKFSYGVYHESTMLVKVRYFDGEHVERYHTCEEDIFIQVLKTKNVSSEISVAKSSAC